MKSKKIILSTLILLSLSLSSGVFISCECQEDGCECRTDCSYGSLSIYESECEGVPSYGVSIAEGKTEWQPSQKGEYYLKILCDNSKKSECQKLKVPSLAKKESFPEIFPYLLLLSLIIITSLLLYQKYQKKKEWDEIKNKVKKS